MLGIPLTLRRAAALSLALSSVLLLPPSPRWQARAASAPSIATNRLEFGLSNGPSDLSWMTGSGVPWRYRYQYISGGVNTSGNWETWQDPSLPPGQFALDYVTASRSSGYIPVFSWYELLQSSPSSGSSESDRDFNNLNDPSTMASYYASFALLMQRAAQGGGSVVVQVEPDLWGYLQQRAGGAGASSLSASVSSSGYAPVAGYPNTAAGFASALIHLRDLYAGNVLLGVHASMWATGIDLASDTSASVNAAAEADKTAAFLASTGSWDLVFDDVDDHDAGWWEAQGLDNQWFTHWWDPTNRVFPNFQRYLDWVAELHARTGLPQIAWQVPVGNQYYLTMNNRCGHYQDNVAQYFINNAGDLYAAGLIAVLFGSGNACQTTYTDADADGVTNNGGAPTSDPLGWCAACNTHPSTVADDDGGYLRMAVGAYYAVTAPPVSGITLDGFGGVHHFGSVANPTSGGPYWPGWMIARGVAACASHIGGYVLDGFGGVHPFGGAPSLGQSAYWPGWDIARGIAVTSDCAGGYVLDGFGGVHPFGNAPPVTFTGYWPGWDVAVAIVLRPDNRSGWVMDGFGGLHPFAAAGTPMPPFLTNGPYWPGWAIARAATLDDAGGGYILDGFGGIHAFGDAPQVTGTAYWPDWDIARGISEYTSNPPSGCVLDGYGGLHAFGGAPFATPPAYLGGQDVFRAIAVTS